MKKILLLTGMFVFRTTGTPFRHSSSIREDEKLTTPKLISKYGYPAEIHHVRTGDDYVLEMHRIPHGVKAPAASRKPVAFLQHGFLGSSTDWVVTGTDSALAYVLADQGYDVWMGNSRGNTYSRKHAIYDPNGKRFWDFSWHEMGVYDLPAAIDYVLNVTDHQNLFYIGHSQGTTQFYVMASERPEYNDKIRAMISLAPVAYVNHAASPLVRIIATLYRASPYFFETLPPSELLPNNEMLKIIAQLLCKERAITQKLFCANLIFLLAGFDESQLNTTILPVITAHFPAGSSFKQGLHYIQEFFSGKFQQYDYKKVGGNMNRYGSETPPSYDLEKITCPVSLHYSSNDFLAGTTDVNRLFKKLKNPIGKFLVPYEPFNHVDFMWAIDVKKLVYDQVISILAKFL